MVNNANSVPPSGSGSPPPADGSAPKSKPTGQFAFTTGRDFLGMHFEPKDWNKLMNTMLQGLSSFINKTFQKATEKMKKDWKRGQGEDVD